MSERAKKILICDDDPRLRMLVARYLGEQGYAARAVEDGAALDRALERETFDLLVLDLMLPGEDGYAILRRLRPKHHLPVIMLSARGADDDRITGLDLGADDYLPKPFNPRELASRIAAILRRAPAAVSLLAEQSVEVCFGGNVVNLATRELRRDGEPAALTTAEFAVLKVLLEHPREPMSRDKLSELARGREHGAFDRAIDVVVSRLRKLLETDPARPRYIQTVWGRGYVFVPDEPQ